MSNELISVLVTLGIAFAAVTVYAALRAAARRPDLGEASDLAAVFVKAAEQTLTDAAGSAKLEWVMAELAQRVKHVDTTLLRALVEAAVFRLKQEQGQGVDG